MQQQQQQQQQQLQQQQQQQQIVFMNGINGAGPGNMPGGMPVATPAGQQSELNYIYGLVEELSRQLTENRRATEEIVAGLGRVRSRARLQGMSNDELLSVAAENINCRPHLKTPRRSLSNCDPCPAQEQNLDQLISLLSESLEKAKYSRDANAQLLAQYAAAFASMLKQFHEYKVKHVSDVASWHRSYRSQLDEARQENSRLREQIWEMQDRAGKANELLRDFRRKYDEDKERWDKRVDERAARQELRFWKRLAMPDLPDDDPYWSDDDDLIDPAETARLKELERKIAQQQQLANSQQDLDEDGQPLGDPGMMGGVTMQRDSGLPIGMPAPPPRPSSTASSTGSSGQ